MDREHRLNSLSEELKSDTIERSTSPWSVGVALVQKRDGGLRLCMDYRQLNDVTIKDAYPLLRINETLDLLSMLCWFSTLDLSRGYWLVEIDPSNRHKTTLISKKRLYQLKVMPFGLRIPSVIFEQPMEIVLCGLQWDMCFITGSDCVYNDVYIHCSLNL